MNFSGKPSEINRFLGFCDSQDPTELPLGLAALARNCDFSLTSVMVRAGINLAAAGVAAGIRGGYKTPVTGLMGLVYTPESAAEQFFQLPILYQDKDDHSAGSLQGEASVGSGLTTEITPNVDLNGFPLVALPPRSHMIGSQAYNSAFLAFSDLLKPTAEAALYSLKRQTLDPYGMKPFGWTWLANARCVIGEVATPAVKGGNGHTYRCIQGGTTGDSEPVWPLTENGHVNDGSVIWEEYTMVLANTLPAPPAPALATTTGGGGGGGSGHSYPNWLANHRYGNGISILPTAGNAGNFVFISQVSQDQPGPPFDYNPQSGAMAPTWPQTPGETVSDGNTGFLNWLNTGITSSGGGGLGSAADVYVRVAYNNAQGTSLASASAKVTTDMTNNAVQVTIQAFNTLPKWMQGLGPDYVPTSVAVYVASVSPGAPEPSGSLYLFYANSMGFGTTVLITAEGVVGTATQSVSTARVVPGRLPQPTEAPAIEIDRLFTAQLTINGKPPVNQVFVVATLNQDITFPANFAGSTCVVGTNPSAQRVFGIGLSSLGQVGFCSISTMGVATFTTTGGAAITGRKGDQLTLYLPGPQDADLSDVSFTFLGNSVGMFPAGRDIYVCCTFVNKNGETTPGPASSIINTLLNDAVQVTVPNPGSYSFTGVNIYEADVPTGAVPPAALQFALVGTFQPGQTVTIIQSAAGFGAPPPTVNTTGPGGAIVADTQFGGLNATQGYRYASLQFINRNFSVSGFTQNSVIQYNVDQNGWELAAFNIATGPSNIAARQVSFTVADGTSAGPFFIIGDYAPGLVTNFVYPATQLSDGENMTATILINAGASSGGSAPPASATGAIFNFSDIYLKASTDVTGRLQVIQPYPCVDIYYSPSTDRMIQTGVPGFNGHWVSLAADPESYYGADVSFIPTASASGERAICAREFRGVLYSLRERSGYVMIPDDANPSAWNVQQRWDKVGPCGPRAVDVSGRFMIFVHRSGIYRYSQDEPEPVKVSKELKYFWQTINWQAANTIWCSIDEEKHTVRIGVPIGQSTVPNQEIMIYYEEGWNMPIHFSTYAAHEISMDSARRYSVQDVQANLGLRIERSITPVANFDQGADGIVQLDSSFYTSQFLYASAGPDGSVMAITPGIWHDGEIPEGGPTTGIDGQYETVCPELMMILCKIEGFNLNARGNGPLQVSFLGGRDMVTDWTPEGGPKKSRELKVRPIDLNVNQEIGITRFVPAKLNERWRMRFTNGKQPDVWFELKYLCIFTIPWASGRPESQS